jgi:hypothetical protein
LEIELSTADCNWFETQGGAARLRRLALPWADLFDAFGVKNDKRATSNLAIQACVAWNSSLIRRSKIAHARNHFA